MSYLEELLGTAEVFHAGTKGKRDEDKAQATVVFDAFDDIIYNDLVDEVPAFSDMINGLDRDYDYAQPLTRDTLQFFWQSDPLVRDRTEMRPEYFRNHAVASDIAEAPETPGTRQFTKHDKYAAAMATIAIGDKLRELLDQYKEPEDDPLQSACNGIKQADGRFAQASDDLGNAIAKMEQAMQANPMDPDAEGPLTPEQAEAAEALMEALAEAQAAREAVLNAEELADELADQEAKLMRASIREALSDVTDTLAEQAKMFSTWGLEPGELAKMDWKTRAALAARLDSKKLKAMRDSVGRFTMRATAAKTKKYHFGRDEVIGTELSGDPARVMASEWALSRHPKLRLSFLQRLAENSLISRKYVGVENVGMGPIVMLTDSSGSMAGVRNTFCKAFGLGMLEVAKAGNRDLFIIDFATEREIRTFDFPKGKGPIDRVIDFAEAFWNGGGTNFMAPLDLAVKVIEERFNDEVRGKADIVLVTDGECGVTVPWKAKWDEKKAKLNFRVFGVMVGSGVTPTLAALCDNVRSVVEFTDPDTIGDIYQAV